MQGMYLWDCAHLGAGVRRGTSHSGSFVSTDPGTPRPAAVNLPWPVETRGGGMEAARVPSLRAGPLGASSGS